MHIDTTVAEECELRNFVEAGDDTHDTETVKLIGRIVLRILQAAEREADDWEVVKADCQMEQTERQNP